MSSRIDAPGSDTVESSVWEALSRIARIARAHNGPLARALCLEIEGAAVAALAVLAKDGALRPSDLASRLGVSHSVASRHVTTLEGLGFVSRTPDLRDGRSQAITVTDAGRAWLEELRQRYRVLLARVFEQWDHRDVEELARLLERFGDDLIALVDGSGTSPHEQS